MFLAMASILLPPAFQAVVTALLMIWCVYNRAWRVAIPREACHSKMEFRHLFRVLFWGLVLSTSFHSLNLLVELYKQKEFEFYIIAKHVKLMGKQGVWGGFLILAYQYAHSRGWRIERSVKHLVVFLVCLVIYMLAQRYWGINWVHGFSSSLPDNRFAYGVYRASGFMSHPLSIAYNSMILSLLCVGLGLRQFKDGESCKYWFLAGALSYLCLHLSASRFPLLIASLLIALQLLLMMPRSKALVTVIILSISGIAGVWSIGSRSTELLDDGKSLQERIPRLVFWDVHWQMFKDNPWAGVGYTKKSEVAKEYYNRLGYQDMERKYSAHNTYLQSLADSGIIGFLSTLTILMALFLTAWFLNKHWQLSTLGIIVTSTFLAGLMQNILRDSEFVSALWSCLAIYFVFVRMKVIAGRAEVKNIQSHST